MVMFFLGASVPFGAVQVGPSKHQQGLGLVFRVPLLRQASSRVLLKNHLNGTGIPDLGDILIMPYTGSIRTETGTQANPGCWLFLPLLAQPGGRPAELLLRLAEGPPCKSRAHGHRTRSLLSLYFFLLIVPATSSSIFSRAISMSAGNIPGSGPTC